MKRIWIDYRKAEDWKSGLFNGKHSKENDYIIKSKRLLCDKNDFYHSAIDMIKKWQVASIINLSNKNSNRKAWVGQATCCFIYGCPDYVTKKAWGLMTEQQQIEANKIADNIIEEFENKYYEEFKKCLKLN